MRKEDLKNKLDNIPQNFDSEALWNRIQPEKKRKKKFLWVFLCAFFMIVALITVRYSTDNPIGNIVVANEENKKYETAHQDPNMIKPNDSKEIGSKNHEESIDQTISSDQNKPSFSSNKNLKNKNQIVYNQLDITEDSVNESNEKDAIVNNSKNTPTSIFSKTNHSNRSYSSEVNTSISVVPHQVKQLADINVEKTTNSTINGSFNSVNNNPEVAFSTITFLQNRLFTRVLPWRILEIDKSSLKKEPLLPTILVDGNMVAISTSFGTDNHTFSPSEYGEFRSIFEEEKERISLGINFERNLYKNFFIGTSIEFTRSQTLVSRTQKGNNWIFISPRNSVNSITSTSYNYYNEYYRIDTRLLAGYSIKVSQKWNLKPAIGIGLNLFSKQQGELLTTELDFVKLEDQREYERYTQLYGFLSLKSERKWGDNKVVGFHLDIESRRKLAENNDYSHSILPVSIGVYVGRRF